jgi:hypothetical protein
VGKRDQRGRYVGKGLIMEREDGFYWVLDGGNWTIACWENRWSPKGWTGILNNTEYNRDDSDFDEIDERRIQRQ